MPIQKGPLGNDIGSSEIAAGAVTYAKLASDIQRSGMKNRIINGAMVIDQRNAGASVSGNDGVFVVDRWRTETSQSGKLTMQQNQGSVTPPAGFRNYIGLISSSAYSLLSTDRFGLAQWIEGYNVADLDFGKTTAKTFTLSFWVRSSLTGTFGVGLIGYDEGSAFRSYVTTYTISSANTWTYISITVPGDTSGTWSITNGHGLYVNFNLGYGSNYTKAANSWGDGMYYGPTGATSVVGTNGATFYITGVQLEAGSTATNFEVRSYGTELALCQRYFQKVGDGGNPYAVLGVGRFSSTTNASLRFPWSVVMRTTPTASFNTATYQFTDGTSSRSVGAISIYSAGTDGCEGDVVTSAATNGNMTQLRGNAASPNAPYINLSAEL